MGGILLSDIKKSRPQAAAMAHIVGFSFYRKSKNSESIVDRKSQTYCGKSDQFVKTSERIVDSNIENMDPNILDISHISISDSVTDEIIENSNLSMMIDPDVFEMSIVSESGKGKLTNGQLVKNISMKDCGNVESAIEADSKSVKGKKSQGNITKDSVNVNVESALEALEADSKSVKGKKRALEAD